MRQSLRHIYRTEVFTAKGKRYGRVREALFDASKPVVVGYIVERPRILYLLDRADRHLAFDSARVSSDRIDLTTASGAFDKAAAKRLGIDWDLTVVWTGMPVRTGSGRVLGSVRDGVFDTETGKLERLEIGSGTAADAAVGTRVIPLEQVVGFSDGFVTVSDEVAAVATSGGAAAVAGRSAAVAKVQAEKAAKTAATYGKAAAKVAQSSSAGKKAKGWLRSVRDEFVDGMSEGDAKDR
jgi:sporulation protein YlmC with PRC-barrel domain